MAIWTETFFGGYSWNLSHYLLDIQPEWFGASNGKKRSSIPSLAPVVSNCLLGISMITTFMSAPCPSGFFGDADHIRRVS